MTIEAGAKVASGTVDALKSQPLALALVIVNVLFLAVAVWVIHAVGAANVSDREHRNKMMDTLMTSCGDKVRDDIEEARMELRGVMDQIRTDLGALKPKG